MASGIVARQPCFSHTHASTPEARTDTLPGHFVSPYAKNTTASSSSFACGRALHITPMMVSRKTRVTRTASTYGGDRQTQTTSDASQKYDVDDSQSFRRKALARLQGLLPAQ